MNQDAIKPLFAMRHSPLRNYIVPGLTSWMIMDNGDAGKVRMFDCSREQQEFITPHSHRFDFTACVLRGSVENTLWVETDDSGADEYYVTRTQYMGEPGKYEEIGLGASKFIPDTLTHKEGEWYGMKHSDIHSIKFAKATVVLFIEGRTITTHSHVLEPWINDERIPTMKTEPWMFKKDAT
jgi:hypothetical protein